MAGRLLSAASAKFAQSTQVQDSLVADAGHPHAVSEVPTFAEAGLPGFEGTIWFGVQAHGATPRAIFNRLSADISRVIMRPDISDALVQQAIQPYVMTPEAFGGRMRSDAESYARIIKSANLKCE